MLIQCHPANGLQSRPNILEATDDHALNVVRGLMYMWQMFIAIRVRHRC